MSLYTSGVFRRRKHGAYEVRLWWYCLEVHVVCRTHGEPVRLAERLLAARLWLYRLKEAQC